MAKLPNIHPGEVLREEFLIPLNMTSYQLAKELGVRQTTIGPIIAGKRAITPRMALRLARYLGTSPEFWLNLQADYDLEEEQARIGDSLEKIRPRELSSL